MSLLCRAVLVVFVAANSLAAGVQVAGRGRSTSTARVTMPALTNYRNCLKSVSVTVDAGATFRILDGGTTIYAVVLSSGGGLVQDWDLEDALCNNSNNTVMELYVSNGNFQINQSTFSR